jgi:hypothetical protein
MLLEEVINVRIGLPGARSSASVPMRQRNNRYSRVPTEPTSAAPDAIVDATPTMRACAGPDSPCWLSRQEDLREHRARLVDLLGEVGDRNQIDPQPDYHHARERYRV